MQIGVMGAASGPYVKKYCKEAKRIGEIIAEKGHVLINGATSGLPGLAAEGAKSKGGLVVGISPGENREEHINKYDKPVDFMDAIIYTGQGYTGRNVLNIRSSDIVIVLPGGMGTATEFTIAYEEGKIIGILEGGLKVKELVGSYYRESNTRIAFDSDPEQLMKKVFENVD